MNGELDRFRMELNETRNNNKNLSLQMESNVKAIQDEWENKCQEMEFSSQKAIVYPVYCHLLKLF